MVAAIGFVLVGVVAASIFASVRTGADLEAPARGDQAAAASATTATDAAARRVWPSEGGFRAVSGGEVPAVGALWRIGDADDSVVLADWTCAGHETALVVTERGGVFFFPRWAAPGEAVSGDRVGHIPAGSRIEPAGTCGQATAIHPSGDRQLLTVSR